MLFASKSYGSDGSQRMKTETIAIATYNLRFGGKAGNRIHWQKVLTALQPDLFFVQETLDPKEYFSEESYPNYQQQTHWTAVHERPWGSAVYAHQGQVTPLESLSPELAGWVTGVTITGFDSLVTPDQTLYAYSVHAPSGRASYVKEVHAILEGICTQVPAGANVVIGGDFNVTVGIRHPSEDLQKSQPRLMARFRRELGLMSCWQMANPNRDLPQTLRWSNDKTQPYHCDGIFAPAHWYRYLEQAEVITGPDWEPLSDHNPVVATLTRVAITNR